MGGAFGGGKSPEPTVPAPAPIPEAGIESAEVAQKKARSTKGFRKTILTGSLSPDTGGKTLLG